MLQRFVQFITENQLLIPQSRVLAAVSGGKDSVLMAHLLKAANYQFGIAHCNFQLRGDEALADEQFCRQLAGQLDVPIYVIRFDTEAYAHTHHVSIQMAARELRYQWFEQIRQQHHYDVIATAHHQNDTIETILLNLVRGTGIAGLHGILPLNNYIVRPLLDLTQTEITIAVRNGKINYREDSSNASAKYARNLLRLEVIPRLKQLNPNLEQTFQRNLDHFRELEMLLQQQVAQARLQVFGTYQGEPALSVKALQQLPSQRLLLSELLKPYGFNQTVADDLISSLRKHSGRQFASVTHQLTLDRDWVILTPVVQEARQPSVMIESGDEIAQFDRYQIRIHTTDSHKADAGKNTAALDAELLSYPLSLRSWQQGDEFYPLGMKGRKKLSDFFINQKVPLNQKHRIPILVNGNGDILWVAGYRISDRYKLTPNTKKVIIFELE
ncbi:tRNA lysidine(34) synthetase TilS [Mucilaginibacter koreensis]